jgi:hypothetical protein
MMEFPGEDEESDNFPYDGFEEVHEPPDDLDDAFLPVSSSEAKSGMEIGL